MTSHGTQTTDGVLAISQLPVSGQARAPLVTPDHPYALPQGVCDSETCIYSSSPRPDGWAGPHRRTARRCECWRCNCAEEFCASVDEVVVEWCGSNLLKRTCWLGCEVSRNVRCGVNMGRGLGKRRPSGGGVECRSCSEQS
jgi:hypothetical protein